MSITECNELVWTKGGEVVCGAKWRIGYPFGRKSRGRVVMIREHHTNCKFKRRTDKRRR